MQERPAFWHILITSFALATFAKQPIDFYLSFLQMKIVVVVLAFLMINIEGDFDTELD